MEFTSRKINTFQPENFYDLTILFLKKKHDTNVWLEALKTHREKKDRAVSRSYTVFHVTAAVFGLLSPFAYGMDMIPYDWYDVFLPNNIVPVIEQAVNAKPGTTTPPKELISIVLTQIILIFAIADLCLWYRIRRPTLFGTEHVPLNHKIFSREHLLRISSCAFVFVMWRKVVTTLEPYLSRSFDVMMFILTIFVISYVIASMGTRMFLHYLVTNFNSTSQCNHINRTFGLSSQSKFFEVCRNITMRFHMDPLDFYCINGKNTRMTGTPVEFLDFLHESQVNHNFRYILYLQDGCSEELEIFKTLQYNTTSIAKMQKLSVAFIYSLMTVEMGLGDDRIWFAHDSPIVTFIICFMSLFYVVGLSQMIGYVRNSP
jgi:hypothetical protein